MAGLGAYMDQINNNEGKELSSFPSFKPLERMPTLLGLPIPVTVLGALSRICI